MTQRFLAATIASLLTGWTITALAGPESHGSDGAAASGSGPDAESAMKAFKLEDGIKAQLFAAEPLLGNPVAFTVDNDGHWYIAETYRQEKGVEDNRSHPQWLDDDIAARTVEDRLAMLKKYYPAADKFAEKFTQYEERITRLEDSDGDGVADHRTIFADGFRDPLTGTGAGILVRGNEVWWTCIPDLWHFRDTNGDGLTDSKEKLLSGFGVKCAFRGHDMHGLRFGPDGKLYFSIGDRGLNVITKEGKTIANPDTGSIMRCNADGTGFEIFATGVRNPQELAFNETGDLFTGDNNSDSGDKARFVHLVEGGDCGWRMPYQYLHDRGPWNRELLWDEKEAPKAKYLIPPIANIANGPSGLTFNPGTGLSERYQNHFFLSDFRGGPTASVVHDIALEQKGAGYKVKERRDLIKGVLTTDCEFGPDGALYVLDWVESWSGTGKGRIYRLTAENANQALQAETQKLLKQGMSGRSNGELATLLGHPDMRVRLAAQFELASKGSSAAPIFYGVLKETAGKTFSKLHAIWGLGQIGEKDPAAVSALADWLKDSDPEVRAQSAKVLGDRKVVSAGDKLISLLKDQNARARYFAALSLGKIGHSAAFEPLCEMLAANNDTDPILRHGGVMGLTGVASAQQLAEKNTDPRAAVRVGAVLALRHQQSPQIAAFLKDTDESVLLEAARAIYDAPIPSALPVLAALLDRKEVTNRRIQERAINAHYRLGGKEDALALAAFAIQDSAQKNSRRDALSALADWAHPNAKDRLLNLWRPLPDRAGTDAVSAATPILAGILSNAPGNVQETAAELAAQLKITSANEALAGLAENPKAAVNARIAAIQSLATFKDPHLTHAAKAAMASNDSRLRCEALQVLAQQQPDDALVVIGDTIDHGTITEKQAAIRLLTEIQRPEAKEQLRGLMDQLIAGNVQPEVQLDVFEAAKKSGLKEDLAKYQETLSHGDELAPYRLALAGGDIDRGRRIFREKNQVQCLRCHRNETGDSQVGPELTKIGAQKDRPYLLESIVYPNKRIAQGFQVVTLILKNDNIVAGRLIGEEGNVLKVESTDEKGKIQTLQVAKADIKERLSSPSPMPDTIRDQLSLGELRDLVEYLATRK